MKAVLVTGSTTRLGMELVRRLLDDPRIGHVVALGLEPQAVGLPLRSGKLTYLRADLTRERRVRQLLFGPVRDLGVEAVVHTAQHRCATDTGRRVHLLNVESTRLMLHLAEEHPTIRSFVLRSFVDVYLIQADQPDVIREDHKIDLRPGASQWVRDRVEADLMTCARMGLSNTRIMVLRHAEILAPDLGSQLHDYLESKVCLRPLGFDPMINVLSVADAARSLQLALHSEQSGVVNIPGRDTLPLSLLIRKWGCRQVALPGGLIGPLYRLRTRVRGGDFRYDLNFFKFHFSAMLSGERAAQVLGYRPELAIDWPVPDQERSRFHAA